MYIYFIESLTHFHHLLLAFLMLGLLYATFMLYEYCPYNYNWIEITLLIWVSSMGMNEIRQIYQKRQAYEAGSTVQKKIRTSLIKFIKHVFGNYWDLLDFTFQSAFIMAFILKNVISPKVVEWDIQQNNITNWHRPDNLSKHYCDRDSTPCFYTCHNINTGAHVLYGISFYAFAFRSMHALMINSSLGPQLQMIKLMLRDLKLFMIIMALFMVTHGVLLKSFKDPEKPFIDILDTLWDLVFFTYFQAYAELFLEDIRNSEIDVRTTDDYLNRCIDKNGIERKGPDNSSICCFQGSRAFLRDVNTQLRNNPNVKNYSYMEHCNVYNDAVTTILSGVYLVIANIIMLNILIAKFNFRYTIIRNNAKRISAYLRYTLILEYYNLLSLPPPIVLIDHLYRVCRMIWKKVNCSHHTNYHIATRKRELTNARVSRRLVVKLLGLMSDIVVNLQALTNSIAIYLIAPFSNNM